MSDNLLMMFFSSARYKFSLDEDLKTPKSEREGGLKCVIKSNVTSGRSSIEYEIGIESTPTTITLSIFQLFEWPFFSISCPKLTSGIMLECRSLFLMRIIVAERESIQTMENVLLTQQFNREKRGELFLNSLSLRLND